MLHHVVQKNRRRLTITQITKKLNLGCVKKEKGHTGALYVAAQWATWCPLSCLATDADPLTTNQGKKVALSEARCFFYISGLPGAYRHFTLGKKWQEDMSKDVLQCFC